MNKIDVHGSREEWERYLEGELTQSRAAELERHAETCADCAESLEETRAFFATLRDAPERLLRTDLVPQVMERIEAPVPRQTRRWVLAPLAAAAVIAVALLPTSDSSEFRAKSSATDRADDWVGLTAYVMDSGGPPQPVDGAVAPDQALAFLYRNIGARPFEYLMIFAVSGSGEVYWYYPAYDDASTNPASVRIEAGAVELPDRVTHELEPGPLHVYGLFTYAPRTVREIEALVGSVEPGERLPVEGAGQHHLRVEVTAR
ncbi:MAG: zf-HC2 domain-containing protein [Deltaproteobacteria bacterium]